MIKIISGKKSEIPKEIYKDMLNLRYRAYLERGFIDENKEKIFQDDYDSHSQIFIALDNGKAVGTLSIVFGKLPLEEIFKKEKLELAKKFKSKRQIEFSKFAIEPDYRFKKEELHNKEKFVSFKLYKKIYKYLLKKRIDLFLIAVNPCYVKKYQKMNFQVYGNQKNFPKMENNPAVLMYQTRKMFLKIMLKNIKPFNYIFR